MTETARYFLSEYLTFKGLIDIIKEKMKQIKLLAFDSIREENKI